MSLDLGLRGGWGHDLVLIYEVMGVCVCVLIHLSSFNRIHVLLTLMSSS